MKAENVEALMTTHRQNGDKAIALRKLRNMYEYEKQQIERKVESDVSSEMVDGNKTFTNDTSRKAEIFKRLDIDTKHQEKKALCESTLEEIKVCEWAIDKCNFDMKGYGIIVQLEATK